MRVEFIDKMEEIERLREPWQELEKTCPRGTLACTYDYAVPWYRHYGFRHGRPMVGLVWEGGTLTGIAPFAYWKGTLGRVPVRRVDLVGHNCEVGELLLPSLEPGTLSVVIEAVRRAARPDVISMKGFSPAEGHPDIVRESAKRTGLGYEQVNYKYAVVDLRAGYETYCRAKSGNFRRTLKIKEAAVLAAGGAQIEVIDSPQDDKSIHEAIDRLVSISNASWKSREGGSMAAFHCEWFRELALRFNRRGMLDFSFLRIGGRDVAYILALVERGYWYDAMVSFDDDFKSLSPGFYLMQAVLKRLPGRGVHTVVSHGDHDYKLRWASGFIPQVCVYLFTGTPVALASHLARFSLEKLLRRVEQPAT